MTEIRFDLLPTSYLFKKDHRIRIALAGADKDHFLVLPSGTAPTVRLARDRQRASAVLLPVVKRDLANND